VSDAGLVVERGALLGVVEETRSPAEEQLMHAVLNHDTVLSCPDVWCTMKAPAMRGGFEVAGIGDLVAGTTSLGNPTVGRS
jgi:hypothetical protein